MMETIQILSNNKRPLAADEDISTPSSKKMMVQPKVEQDSCDLFSLVSAAAEQQRQAQEDQVERIHSRQLLSLSRDGIRPIAPLPTSSSATPSSSSTPVFPSTPAAAALAAAAGRTITFTIATSAPSVYTVPAADLASISLFRSWVKKCFDIRDDKFTLVDRTRGGRNKEIDTESKLATAKEISILPCFARPQKAAEETISTDILVHSNINNNTASISTLSSSASTLSTGPSTTAAPLFTTPSFVTPLPPSGIPVSTSASAVNPNTTQPTTTTTPTLTTLSGPITTLPLNTIRIPTARQQLSTSSPAVSYYAHLNGSAQHLNLSHLNGSTNSMNSSSGSINSTASNGYHHLSHSTNDTNTIHTTLSHSTNGANATNNPSASSSSTTSTANLLSSSTSSTSITSHINNLNSSTSSMQGEVPTLSHQELFMYAKSILVFLADKGHAEARSLMHVCPSFFSPPSPPNEQTSPSSPHLSSSTSGTASNAPTLPRVLAQAPPCLIPGYYIFSPVFDSFGEKRKLPIKIEIPRNLVWTGERYKTVSTYIGLGPFGDDPTAYVKLEGDHLIGTVASRFDDEDDTSPTCLYVFKNLRLKTRCLIRTVLDVSYSGMRTGRFFFTIDNEVLPTPSRKFEIKAPSGYTIKMVNKNARSNPVEKHTLAPAPAPPAIMPASPPAVQRLIQYNTSPPPLTSSV